MRTTCIPLPEIGESLTLLATVEGIEIRREEIATRAGVSQRVPWLMIDMTRADAVALHVEATLQQMAEFKAARL